MKKVYINSIIVGSIVMFFACSPELQTYDLSEEYTTSLHYQPPQEGSGQEEEAEEGSKSNLVGVPARNFYGGDLKRGGIWWAGRDITLEKGEEFFIFSATNVGPDSIPFGATFPPLDLTKEELAIKISARAEGENGTTPELYMQVDDAEGYKSNARWPSNKIENSQEFKDYYFELKDIFMQSFPKKHKVNGALINSLKFFINPGQTGFSGEIFIQEIKVVPASSVVK